VQRRTPPYLLVVFVILFIFATVMAVLFLNKFNTAQEKLKISSGLNAKIISHEQVGRAEITTMMDAYDRSPGNPSNTVVGQLSKQVASLAYDLTGSPNSTYEDAKQQVKQTFQAVNPPSPRGVLKYMRDYDSGLDIKQAEIAKLNAATAQVKDELAGAKKELDDAKVDFEAKLADKANQISALDKKFENAESGHATKLGQAEKTFNEAIGQARKQVDALAGEVKTRDDRIAILKRKIAQIERETTPGHIDTGQTIIRPDGKVRTVIQDEGMAYLDIGAKDRVTEGLRLTVFPYTGVNPTGQGKGVVEVYDVSDNVCEARIIQQSKDDPIITGDLVANLVFDALRNYEFVVEGNFDLNSTGTATPAGNKAVKELIRRYGGAVVNELSINTAFVILGDPPGRPRKPGENDPQGAWTLYQERMKDYNRYQEIKGQAAALKIPLISSDRFLDLVGYVPTKKKAG